MSHDEKQSQVFWDGRPWKFVRRLPAVMLSTFVILLLTGCHPDHRQSMLHPAGEAANKVYWLWWVLLAITTFVFLYTMALAGIAVFRKPSGPLGNKFIAGLGIFIPAGVLTAILVLSVDSQVALMAPPTANQTVRVTGHLYWWEVEYPQHGIIDANEIHIPTGERVLIELTSRDVIHSFWVPNLNGKMDLLPNKVTRFWLAADQPGVYRGQCAEYCGAQHAKMAFEVVAVPPEEFAAWVAARQQPHPEPATEELSRGRELFFSAACHNCHAIRGTAADGRIGPDLTHMGSRLTIGAATVPNTRENLIRWIRDPHIDKPRNLMPHSTLPLEDIAAIAAYLESLK
jgi:cytochrome c oxidase subunit 2